MIRYASQTAKKRVQGVPTIESVGSLVVDGTQTPLDDRVSATWLALQLNLYPAFCLTFSDQVLQLFCAASDLCVDVWEEADVSSMFVRRRGVMQLALSGKPSPTAIAAAKELLPEPFGPGGERRKGYQNTDTRRPTLVAYTVFTEDLWK